MAGHAPIIRCCIVSSRCFAERTLCVMLVGVMFSLCGGVSCRDSPQITRRPQEACNNSSRIPFLCLFLSSSALLLRWFGPHIPMAYVMMERTPVSSSVRLMLGVIHVSTLTVSLSVASAFLLLSTVWAICSWSPPLPSVFTPRYLY